MLPGKDSPWLCTHLWECPQWWSDYCWWRRPHICYWGWCQYPSLVPQHLQDRSFWRKKTQYYRLWLYDSDFDALNALWPFCLLFECSYCCLSAIWPRKLKIDCSRQVWTERTDKWRSALLVLLSEPKIETPRETLSLPAEVPSSDITCNDLVWHTHNISAVPSQFKSKNSKLVFLKK